MPSLRDEKLGAAIMEAAAAFLARESNRTSLITVTNIIFAERGKICTILCTVFPREKETEAIEFLKRMRSDLKEYIADNTRIARLPARYDFALDIGEKNRQTIDELIEKSK